MPRGVRLGYDPTDAFQDDDDGPTQFIAGFSSGIKQTQALLGGGLPALVQSAIGDEEDAIEYLDYYNKKMEEAAEIGGDFQRVEDIEGAEDAVQWLTYTLGKALPDLGTSIVGGLGTGAVVQYGAKKLIANTVENQVKQKAGKAFEKAMVKRELNRRTQKARKFGQVGGAMAASTGMNAGETFANVYEESGGIQDPALALATGLAAGSLDALAPLSILKKVLPDNMSEPFKEMMADRLLRNKGMVKRAFIEGVRTGGIEGATEAAQEVLQAAAVGMFNDPQSGYKSYGESFFQALNDPTEQQRSQYLNAFAAGVVGGGGMGGVSGAFYKPRSAPEKSPMPDSEGNMPVETPQSEELEAQQAGFDSYSDYLDAYEGMATMNRTVSIEAIQAVIPDQFYMGQDMTPEQDAEYEAETERLRQEFNPKLDDLVGQVVGQGEAEGVLRRREDGTFFVRDFDSGEEVSIKTRKSGGDQSATDVGVERRNNEVELERDSRVRFNPEDSTFTSPDRGEKPFKYIRTNYGQDGEVESVTAEVMEGATAGEERVFQKRMASQIESARIQAEGATALQETRGTLSRGRTQADIEGNLSSRADEGVPETMLDPPVPQQPQQQQPQAPTQAAQQPAVMTDMAEVDIADRVATSLASALGDVIRAVTNPQAQTQQQAPQPSSPARVEGANQGQVIEAGNTRAVIDTDDPEAADTLQRQFSETEERRQQQLGELDRQIEAARQPDDGRMGAADVQNMLDNRMGASDIQARLEADDRMGASDVQGMLEADDRMGAQDVRNMLDDDTPMMRRDSEPRGATRRPVVTDEELNAVIDRVVGGNQETRDLINVVDRFDQLPAELQEAARQQGSDGSDVDAVSHNGQIYIVKGRMKSGSRLERALLHEGTHGGIEKMFADVGVSKALNAMFDAMGGQKGFNRIVDELGIRERLKTYEEAYSQPRYSKETRNYVMVSEMLAYTGEEGGKTLKSRIREVIGAIRDWLRSNGFARLSKMRASDIALIAKNAREDYFRNDQARQDGQPLFSRVRDRAGRDQLGFYSNAEQMILDAGDKVFQTSKKNPEGRIKGDRILSFLTGRGLKKEEAKFSKIKQLLTDPESMNEDDQVKTFYVNRVHERIEKEIRDAGREITAEEKAKRFVPLIEDYFSNFNPADSRPELTKEKIKELKEAAFIASEESGTGGRDSITAVSAMNDINQILSRLDISQLAEMSGRPADTFTKEEIIDYLQDSAPDLEEYVRYSGLGSAEIMLGERNILDGFEYFEHLWDDIQYSMRRNEWDDYGSGETLRKLVANNRFEITEYLQDRLGDSLGLDSGLNEDFSASDLAEYFDSRGMDLNETLRAQFESELDDIAWRVAEEDYMADPYFEQVVYSTVNGRRDDDIGEINGSEGGGFTGRLNNGKELFGVVYRIEDAIEAFEQYAMEEGLGGIDSGDTEFFGHMKIDPRTITRYREKIITLGYNRLAPNNTFDGGHFGYNTLFNVLATDRETPFGEALAIEENQSDWHNAIREAGSPFDAVAVEELAQDQERFKQDREGATFAYSRDLEALVDAMDTAAGRMSPSDRAETKEDAGRIHAFEKMIGKYLSKQGLEIFLRQIRRANDPDSEVTGKMALEAALGDLGVSYGMTQFNSDYFVGEFDTSGSAVEKFIDDFFKTPSYIARGFEPRFKKMFGYAPTEEPSNQKQADTRSAYEKFIRTAELFEKVREDLVEVERKMRRLKRAPPDSPFRNDAYLDVSAKGILRDAVMEGKTAIAFSNATRLINRWDEQYEKGYRFIYDNKLPAIFKRLTGEDPVMMTPDNKLVSDDNGLWGKDPNTEKRIWEGNGLWLVRIPPEVAEQIKTDGMPMFRRITNQTNTHEEAANKGELLNGRPANNEFNLHDETRGELWLRTIQDKYLPLKKFEEASAKLLGLKELPDALRGYIGETLHSGKQKRDMDDLEKDYIAPLASVMRDNDIDVDDLGLYLIAKHAKERNDYIASINEKMPDGGSGMYTEDAKRVIEELENPSFINAAQIIYDMLAANRKRMAEFGLVDQDTIDAWQDRYKFYVPLKGFATSRDGDDYIPPRGNLPRGFNISGRETFKALGRQSQAENPVHFSIADSEEKIGRARRAEPARQFLALADEMVAAESDQLKVYRPDDLYPIDLRATDAKGNVIEQRMKAPDMRTAKRKNGDIRFMTVKEDGNEVFIEIKNDALNRVMQQLDAEDVAAANGLMKSVTDKMRTFQTFRRNMLINWNPSWFLINPIRDLQTGLMYNLAEESKAGGMTEGENLTGEILRRYFPAWRAYLKNIRGNKADNEYDAYYDEYTKAGASTGLTLIKDIEEQRKALFALVTDGPLTAAGKRGLREIENLNTTSENAIRFATYVSAREAGISVQKSANLAKNLTVNFNRKGEISDSLNLLYLFFNAAVQGTANIAQALDPSSRTADGKFTKAQVAAAGIALTAYMVTEYNLAASAEDDDGESLYNDLSDYDHLMSWNIAIGDGTSFAQIPMPYGYGFFHTLGRLGAEYLNETKDEVDVAAEIVASFAHHMLPPPLGFIGTATGAEDLGEVAALAAGSLAPTITEPLAAFATNTNHFGAPIYLEDNPLIKPPTPSSSRSKRSTSDHYKIAAEWINEQAGGSKYRSSWADLSPDGMQYIQEYIFGGLGRFVNRSADLYAKVNTPANEEITASNVPIVRYFHGEPSDYSDKLDYYGYIDSATQIFKEAGEITGADRIGFMREFGSVAKLEPLYKETQKKLRKLRQRKKQIEKAQKDPVKAYDQVQRVEAEMQKLFDQFNKRYREATK